MDSVQKLYVELSQNMNLLEASERAVNKDINFNYKNFKNLNLSNLQFSYGDKRVIKNLNLNVKRGDFIGLLGKSGEGKTTLVDLILGIHEPKSGEISVNGISIFENMESWRNNLAYLPQETFFN